MADILAIAGNVLASTGTDPIAPITQPTLGQPATSVVSVGAAAAAAAGQATPASANVLGVDFGDPSVKNLLFMAFVGYIYFKFWR
jgi:hypothetical protein